MSGGLVKLALNGQHDIVGKRRRGSGFPPLPTRGQALRGNDGRSGGMTEGKRRGGRLWAGTRECRQEWRQDSQGIRPTEFLKAIG